MSYYAPLLIIFMIGVFVTVFIEAVLIASSWQQEAIAHHAAHYELNEADGTTTFKWNDEGKK